MCEGFRLASSDMHWMLVCRDVRVIFSLPTEKQCNDERTLLVAERYATKPGFALLRLLSRSPNADVTNSRVSYEKGYYVTSQKWRVNMEG